MRDFMMSAKAEGDVFRLDIEVPHRILLMIDEDYLEKLGKVVGHTFVRHRNKLLCERDGHVEPELDSLKGVRCDRCLDILDQEAFSKLHEWPKR